MKPISFKEHTHVLAKDQKEYLPLPVFMGEPPEHDVVSCWKMSLLERIKILFTGIVWIRQLTFGNKFHPILPEIKTPFIHSMDEIIDEELK